MKHHKIVKENKETQTKINHSVKELCFLLISAYTDLVNAVVASEEDIDLSDPSIVLWLEKIEKKAKKLKEKCLLSNNAEKKEDKDE